MEDPPPAPGLHAFDAVRALLCLGWVPVLFHLHTAAVRIVLPGHISIVSSSTASLFRPSGPCGSSVYMRVH